MNKHLFAAKQLIEKCKVLQEPTLDLGQCGITDLNDLPELFECTHLETLNFSNYYRPAFGEELSETKNHGPWNRMTSLPTGLSKLKNLKNLILGSGFGQREKPVSLQFQNLQRIDALEYVQLAGHLRLGPDFSDWASHLQYLDISLYDPIDCRFLGKLSNLHSLKIACYRGADLSFLQDIPNLRVVELDGWKENKDFSVLEHLLRLQSLILKSTYIANTSFLERLPDLRSLKLDYGWFQEEKATGYSWRPKEKEIPNYGFLERMSHLESLSLTHTDISHIPSWESLPKLKSLSLPNCKIKDASFFGYLTELQSLNLLNCHFKGTIPHLDKLTKLEKLSLPLTFINDVQNLAGLRQLKYLDLSNNSIPNIDVLSGLTELEVLSLFFNQISNIQPLKGLYKLKELHLGANRITSIKALADLTHLTTLGLNKNRIFDISCLRRLSKLKFLNLNENYISDISALKNLTNLQTLDLSKNRISKIDDLENLMGLSSLNLSANQISNISSLADLTNLQLLNLSQNQVSDLGGLHKMTKLQSLDVSQNRIENLDPLVSLFGLHVLKLSNNAFTDLFPLEALVNLTGLDVSGNAITDLSAIKQLKELTKLQLNDCDLEQLPRFLFEHFPEHSWGSDIGLGLKNNPIESPPAEIIKQGLNSLLDWFNANKRELNEIKVIMIGEPKAGKTSLLRRFVDGSFRDGETQTDGINIESISFKQNPNFQRQVSLHELTGHFWDFGGQEILNATHQFFLTKRSVYILVLDARKDTSISGQIREWIKRIKATGGNSPIIVVANKIDINPGFGFENEYELGQEFPQIEAFISISCKEPKHIDLLKDKLEEVIPKAELFHTEIDERWIEIKDQLQEETQDQFYLDQRRFKAICGEHQLFDPQQQKNAITFLHDLGLVLHFDGIELSDYYVLDPYWITYGVYQIITSSLAGSQKGRVKMGEQLLYILNEELDKEEVYRPRKAKSITYSPNEARFLVDILQRFKLCYYLPDRTAFILPNLLDTKEPTELTKPIRTAEDKLQFAYQYSYLPRTIMPNIMVEAHSTSKHLWRTGCLLEHNGSKALIVNYGNMITLIVTGQHKQKREFMTVIRFVIDQVNKNLQDRPAQLIPLPSGDGYVDYEELLEREREGEMYYRIFKPQKKKFEISRLLEGISKPDDWSEIKEELLSIKMDTHDLLKGNRRIIRKLNKTHSLLLAEKLGAEQLLVDIQAAVEELQTHQIEEITTEVLHFLTTIFSEWDQEVDTKLQQLYADLKKSDHMELKLKLGVPLLNVLGVDAGIEAKYDVKGWMKKMQQRYSFRLFQFVEPLQR